MWVFINIIKLKVFDYMLFILLEIKKLKQDINHK